MSDRRWHARSGSTFRRRGAPRHWWMGALLCVVGSGMPGCGPADETVASPKPTSSRPPNILFFLVDDLGLEALSAYGGTTYSTPAIDALADRGMTFDHCFATPACTASRVQLLTGRYPFRTGWDRLQGERPADDRTLDVTLPSLARGLQRAGYATALAGKWHLAHFSQAPHHVTDMGFDEHCAWTHKLAPDAPIPSRYWKPSIWTQGKFDKEVQKDDVYGPEVFTEFLVDFVDRHQDRPFFAFYSMCLVHRPYVATPQDIGDLRSARTAATPSKKGEDVPQQLARFGSNVEYLDHVVGRLVQHLESRGLVDNTVIVFTSDNGTDARITSHMGNLAVAGGKTEMNDRGAAVPLIVRWDGVVTPGTRHEALLDFTDFFPTLLDIAGETPIEAEQGDGASFLPTLRDGADGSREWVYVEESGRWFVRDAQFAWSHDHSLFDVSDRFGWQSLDSGEWTPAARQAQERLSRAARKLREP